MRKRLLIFSGLFISGLIAGIAIMSSSVDVKNKPESAMQERPASNPFAVVNESDSDRIRQLEQELRLIKTRVATLENRLSEQQTTQSDELENEDNEVSPAQVDVSMASRVLSIESLVKAGLDEAVADNILRRRNQLELARLELRDRASREGFLGTQRYSRELAALNTGDMPLRDEIGDEAYDRYLYATEQNNRVKVVSVMMGSAAEQAGILSGDLIRSYNGNTVFKWTEVQQATAGGELGEYVPIGISRDGLPLNLWVPRGPLGVRLDATRLNPGG